MDARAHTSAWEEAIAFGVDVTLLEANLARTPAERLRELSAMNRLHAAVQTRTLTPAERRRLDADELQAKFGELLRDAP